MERAVKPLCPLHSLKWILLHCHMCTQMKCLHLLQYTGLTKGTCAWAEDKARQTCTDDANLCLRLPLGLSAKNTEWGVSESQRDSGRWQRQRERDSDFSLCLRWKAVKDISQPRMNYDKAWWWWWINKTSGFAFRFPRLIISPLISFHLCRRQHSSHPTNPRSPKRRMFTTNCRRSDTLRWNNTLVCNVSVGVLFIFLCLWQKKVQHL